jgi:DNA gyrase subunit B
VLRGHVYIAQPPLYKVKKGKQERYLKDERALEEYLFHKALDGWTLTLPSGVEIKDASLVREMKKWGEVKALFAKLERRGYARTLVDALLTEGLLDEDRFQSAESVAALGERLTVLGLGQVELETTESTEVEDQVIPAIHSLKLTCMHLARPIALWIDQHVAHWGEFRRLKVLKEDLAAFRGGELKLRRTSQAAKPVEDGEDTEEAVSTKVQPKEMTFSRAEDLLTVILEEGKRGVSIQRYKGLGEMNPEQLWETTMDPERRTLLRVMVDDAVEADEIFTILMGDAVEPRRRFIENNALLAENLDV